MGHEWIQAMRVSGYFDEILDGFVWRDHLIQSRGSMAWYTCDITCGVPSGIAG